MKGRKLARISDLPTVQHQSRVVVATFLLAWSTYASGQPPAKTASVSALPTTVSALKQSLGDIDNELQQLASLSLRSGIGSTGYRSQRFAKGNSSAWVQIDWGETISVNQIVLVPTIWRESRTGFRADGFPLQFHLLVGSRANPSGTLVASYDAEDLLLPRIAPLVVNCPTGTSGSWVRLVANTLGSRLWDGRYDLQLSEVMVFCGEENVALHGSVEVSSSDTPNEYIDKRFLVDGHVPYLMDAKSGEKSIAYVCAVVPGTTASPTLVFDLGETCEISRIHLHAVDTSDTVPQSHGTDFAIPRKLRVVGSTNRDLSQSKQLCRIDVDSIYDSGPILMRRFPKTSCRYVALVADEPYAETGKRQGVTHIGFAEVEIFADGQNVAMGKNVEARFKIRSRGRNIAALTDGRNFYGDVLSLREWMNQLARRHELESMRPRVQRELDNHYTKQLSHLRLARWLAALLAVAVGFSLLRSRLIRARELANLKERFAADLHDELGANLHTIGLLSDLAEDVDQTPEEVSLYLQRIRALSERTGIAMRNCVDVQESGELYANVIAEMRQAAERIVANLEHTIEFEGERYVNDLKLRTRVDLLLFYKECLVNVSRHSGATSLSTELKGSKHNIELIVTDNGQGISNQTLKTLPPSLRRRAKLLGATANVKETSVAGTSISLNLRTRRLGRKR